MSKKNKQKQPKNAVTYEATGDTIKPEESKVTTHDLGSVGTTATKAHLDEVARITRKAERAIDIAREEHAAYMQKIVDATAEQQRLAAARLEYATGESSPERQEQADAARANVLRFLKTVQQPVAEGQLAAPIAEAAGTMPAQVILDPLVAAGRIYAGAIAAGGGIRYWA